MVRNFYEIIHTTGRLGELMYLWYKKKSVSWKEMTFESFNA